MSYALTYEGPIDPDVYARIKQELGPELPPGMILHLAHRTEQGLRYLEVWSPKRLTSNSWKTVSTRSSTEW